MTTLVLIDDEIKYCQTLQTFAKLKDFDIRYFTNYEEGFEYLHLNDLYSGVILDARCFRNKEAEADKETKDSGIFYAVSRITDLVRNTGRPVPYCVNTGFSASFRENLEQMDVMVFDKAIDRDKMLAWFRDEIERMPETKIRNNFPDVFETFSLGHLDANAERKMLLILSLLDNKEITDIRELLFNPVRQILEAIYKGLNKTDDKIIPGVAINYERNIVNITWCMKRLSTGDEFRDPRNNSLVVRSINPPLPESLGSMLHFITRVVSAKSHDSELSNHSYLIKSVVYGLLEIVLWYKTFINSKKN
ncbi:MAG TPA: hypothetical protein PLX41_04875 [Bacteroidales bacterium]|nr:hypothetical protein [Bacteroidales bacterium]